MVQRTDGRSLDFSDAVSDPNFALNNQNVRTSLKRVESVEDRQTSVDAGSVIEFPPRPSAARAIVLPTRNELFQVLQTNSDKLSSLVPGPSSLRDKHRCDVYVTVWRPRAASQNQMLVKMVPSYRSRCSTSERLFYRSRQSIATRCTARGLAERTF